LFLGGVQSGGIAVVKIHKGRREFLFKSLSGEDRFQATLFPERLDDYVAEDSACCVIDVFLVDL